MICPTPTNHVRNLDEDLNIDESVSTTPTPVDLPQPPPDHLISMLTLRLHTVIQQDNVGLLKSTIKLLEKSMESNFDFVLYDCSAFDAAWKTASDILASHASIVPDLPPLLLLKLTYSLLLASNLLSSILRPGVENLWIFTPGCRTS